MSHKSKTTEAQAKNVWLILQATNRGMTSREIYEHQMFKPVATTPKTLGQVLAHMKRKGTITRSRGGTMSAKWLLAKVPPADLPQTSPSQDTLALTVNRSSNTLSLQMGGVNIELTIKE